MMLGLPIVAQAYKILLQEETHLQLSTSGGSMNEPMACMVDKRKYQDKTYSRNYNQEGNKGKRPTLWCEHCKITRHIKEKC